VAVDKAHVYWAENSGAIGRSNIDGTNPKPNFITTNGGRPTELAVNGNFIYWANRTGGTIGRTKPTAPTPTSSSSSPRSTARPAGGTGAIAIDADHIY
jgi:hypothetical protein